MEPLVVSGMTPVTSDAPNSPMPPQWGPLVVSGMTSEIPLPITPQGGPQWSPLVVSGLTAREVSLVICGFAVACERCRSGWEEHRKFICQGAENGRWPRRER